MRAFLTACLVIIVAAGVGLFILDSVQQTTEVAYTTTGARI
jgi:hypothetical protein